MAPQSREWIYLPRSGDLTTIFEAIRSMDCLSLVGVSNLGKSATLRSLSDQRIQAQHLGEAAPDYLFIYIDFNQMLVMSDQAFYELVLRACIDALRELSAASAADPASAVLRDVEAAYRGLVAPASAFEVPLRFAQAMAAIGDQLPQRVVFLFDELDGPMAGIDGRVFLNLRALRDRHQQGVTYITATNRRLAQIRTDADVAEFIELFEHATLFISMLTAPEMQQFVQRFAREEGVTFSAEDLAFIGIWAGGHPALLETTCRILGLLTGKPMRDASQDVIIHRRAAEVLTQDLNIQAECRKIWHDLSDLEQDALLAVSHGNGANHVPGLNSVIAKHLVVANGAECRIFARAYAEFVQRQHIARRSPQAGLRVDLDSGEVWVNGQPVETLTNLEYRLLLLLYGRIGKIVEKYDVVEAVWGEDYLEKVDDARIEKLISRLRQKIEPDVQNPKYLQTVRGRGYKLTDA